jgi:hypothetical protein
MMEGGKQKVGPFSQRLEAMMSATTLIAIGKGLVAWGDQRDFAKAGVGEGVSEPVKLELDSPSDTIWSTRNAVS